MKIRRDDNDTNPQQWADWHVLTVAETDPSMLDVYGRLHRRLNPEVIRNFVAQVNKSDTCGSLHPNAPISAVPRRVFQQADADGSDLLSHFKRCVAAFIEANRNSIQATRVVVDFNSRGAPVSAHCIEAMEEVFRLQSRDGPIEEVVILV